MISDSHKTNFETFQRAAANGRVALMECYNRDLDRHVTVLCMVSDAPDGEFEFVPFAQLFNGNPYDVLCPPLPDGKFACPD